LSIFNDTSIITKRRKGTSDDPFVSLSESHQIENNSVILSEIPSSYTKVLVTGAGTIWYEIPSGIPSANQYVVDYIANIITFEASRNGLQLQFNFKGTGLHYVPASMVYTKIDGNNNVIETLQDVVTNATPILASEVTRVSNEITRQSDNTAFKLIEIYNSTHSYLPLNKVTYQGSTYQCILACLNVLPTNVTNWILISLAGSGTNVTNSTTNGNIKINGTETTVYNDILKASQLDLDTANSAIALKANNIDLGTLASLGTVVKTDAVSAINENTNQIAILNGVGGNVEKANKTDLTTETNARLSDKAETTNYLADKATHAELQSVASGTPRTNYSTVALLTAGIPAGDIYSYVCTDGHRYWWNGSVWVDGGVYQSMGLSDNSIFVNNLSTDIVNNLRGKSSYALLTQILATCKNLFNQNDLYSSSNYYINPNNGTITSTGFLLKVSNPILIDTSNTQLTISASSNLNITQGYRFLDANNTVISYGAYTNTTSRTLNIPFNAVSFQCTQDLSNSQLQVEYGSLATAYVSYSAGYKYTADIKTTVSKLASVLSTNKNLFNKNNLYSDGAKYYIKSTDGSISSTSFNIAMSIPILIDFSRGNLTMSTSNPMSSTQGYRFLDYKGNMVSYGAYNNTGLITIPIPTDVIYFQCSLDTVNLVSLQIEYGTVATAYVGIIDNVKSSFSELSYVLSGKNLFNKNKLYSDGAKYYIKSTDGTIITTAYTIAVSSPILIDSSQGSLTLSAINPMSSTQGYRFLDYNGNVISYGALVNAVTLTKTIPTNATYFQTSLDTVNLSSLQIEYGTTATAYIENYPYVYENIDIALPSVLKLCKNKNISLYYDNFMLKDYKKNVYTRIDTVSGMTNYSRQFAGTPTASDKAVGSFTVSYTNSLYNRITNSFSYKIVDATVRTNKSLNIMCCGDSYTEIGWWVDSLVEKANADGVTLNTIGLMDTFGKLGFTENQTGGTLSNTFLNSRASTSVTYKLSVSNLTVKDFAIHFEQYASYTSNGYSWTVTGYKLDGGGNGYMRITSTNMSAILLATGTLAKTGGTGDTTINYTSSEVLDRNPLWNSATSQVDFQYYINKWSFAAPDVLLFMFGWNDYGTWADPSSFITNCKTFIDLFHAQYPNAHVIFSIPPFGYTEEPTKDVNGNKYSRLLCAKKMFSTFATYSFVDIVTSYAFVDHINGYSTYTIQPNSRYSEIITLSRGCLDTNIGNDDVHNNINGMKQIGDAVYPYLVDLLV